MREYSIILLILVLLLFPVSGQENTANYLAKANELNNNGEYDAAIPLYDKAIDKEPNNADAWNGRGLALQNLEKYEESIACFDKAVQLNSSLKEAWYNKGYSLIELNRYPEARDCEKKALEIDPRYCNAINDMGLSYYYERDYKKAMDWYNKVLDICPTMAVTWANIALLLYDTGQNEEANAKYQMAKKYGFEGSPECDKKFGQIS